MLLMAALGLALASGLVLTGRWGTREYEPWTPGGSDEHPARSAALVYLRGIGLAVAAGFWAGLLVTGPAIRLIMRLLAATSDDRAQGRLTEAGEVVGRIDLGGTLALIVFGGMGPAVISAAVYLLVRRWLPAGWLAGPVFGVLHLVVLATRLDPLRPDNPDFDLVGPAWLAVTTFGAAAVVHGMTVVAFVDRLSAVRPARRAPGRRVETAAIASPLVLAAGAVAVLGPVALGAGVAALLAHAGVRSSWFERRGVLVTGRVAGGLVALATLPGTVVGLGDILA